MTGWRHYQEAGVVAYNKMQHFLGILMMFPLALWSEPVQSSIGVIKKCIGWVYQWLEMRIMNLISMLQLLLVKNH